jgi:hypothetical protein
MLTLREKVLAVVTHLQADPAAAARLAVALHLPMLCRFAASDDVSVDGLQSGTIRRSGRGAQGVWARALRESDMGG